jgi:hypothetical protein
MILVQVVQQGSVSGYGRRSDKYMPALIVLCLLPEINSRLWAERIF